MNRRELTEYNLGLTLDHLMTLDPRGYGVCRILYERAAALAGEPVSMHMARRLYRTLRSGDTVWLLTGFVLAPWNRAETDGAVGTMFLARAIQKACGVRTVLVCQEENVPAAGELGRLLGLSAADGFRIAAAPKDSREARRRAETLYAACPPAAVLASETPGANARGVYHNATGADITAIEGKTDVFFVLAAERGADTYAVGDLGNETGMRTLQPQLDAFVPYCGTGQCRCGCGGGIAAETAAGTVLTATASDWGCDALCAALAYLSGDLSLMPGPDEEERALRTANACGLIDMYGDPVPAVDGFSLELNRAVVSAMRESVKSTLERGEICAPWFGRTLEKGFFQK